MRRLLSARAGRLELALLMGGAVARLAVAARGHNYDVDSYLIVDAIQERGGNVYAETSRYNYGPVWFLVLRVMGMLTRHDPAAFRLLLVVFLIGVDLAVWLVLRRRFGRLPALLFFLNPVQIVICGYHNQFDTLAVLVGLLAVAQLDRPQVSSRRLLLGVGLLGLSLVVKHLLFVFPIWLALRERSAVRRLAVLVIPAGLFVVSFAPYLSHEGLRGIVQHVLLYASFRNDPIWHVLSLGALPVALATPLFLLTLVACGVLLRRCCPTDLALAYLLVLVVASPSMANQYLAIASVPLAVWWRPLFGAFTALGGVFLLAHPDGLHLAPLRGLPGFLGGHGPSPRSYDLLIAVLSVGTVLQIRRLRANATGTDATTCSRCGDPAVLSQAGPRLSPDTSKPVSLPWRDDVGRRPVAR